MLSLFCVLSARTLTQGGGLVPSDQVTASTSIPHILISCFSVADRTTVSGLGLNRSACDSTRERQQR